MTRETYLEHLDIQLKQIEAKLDDARARQEKGDLKEKVAAAGELSLLEEKHREISEKIKQASANQAENWSLLHTELREDLDALLETLDRWITRHRR